MVENAGLKVTSAWPASTCSSTAGETKTERHKKKHPRVTGIPAACHPPFSVRSHFKKHSCPSAATFQSAHSVTTFSDQLPESCGVTLPPAVFFLVLSIFKTKGSYPFIPNSCSTAPKDAQALAEKTAASTSVEEFRGARGSEARIQSHLDIITIEEFFFHIASSLPAGES